MITKQDFHRLFSYPIFGKSPLAFTPAVWMVAAAIMGLRSVAVIKG